jgi:hypothetical protein
MKEKWSRTRDSSAVCGGSVLVSSAFFPAVAARFELLSNEETAQVRGLKPSAASNRPVRALKRLKEVMALLPGAGDSAPGP